MSMLTNICSPFSQLPDEIALEVLKHCGPKTLGICSQVSKWLQLLSTDQGLWREKFEQLKQSQFFPMILENETAVKHHSEILDHKWLLIRLERLFLTSNDDLVRRVQRFCDQNFKNCKLICYIEQKNASQCLEITLSANSGNESFFVHRCYLINAKDFRDGTLSPSLQKVPYWLKEHKNPFGFFPSETLTSAETKKASPVLGTSIDSKTVFTEGCRTHAHSTSYWRETGRVHNQCVLRWQTARLEFPFTYDDGKEPPETCLEKQLSLITQRRLQSDWCNEVIQHSLGKLVDKTNKRADEMTDRRNARLWEICRYAVTGVAWLTAYLAVAQLAELSSTQ